MARPPLIPLESTNDAKDLLQERAQSPVKLRGVVIIETLDDGTQHIFTSTMSMEEKCFIKCFFDSWVNHWFNHEDD